MVLGNSVTPHLLELTWLRDRTEPYDLGKTEFHLAFETEDFEELISIIGIWAVFVLKIRKWGSILLVIPMVIG